MIEKFNCINAAGLLVSEIHFDVVAGRLIAEKIEIRIAFLTLITFVCLVELQILKGKLLI